MNSLPGIALYNQDRLDDETFVDNFVARRPLLETILNQLRAQLGDGPSEHLVLIGARGMGKTSLLRRIAIGVGHDADLDATFAPLRFREEQYNVISPDALWRNCGDALAEWLEATGSDAQADRLDREMERPAWRDPEESAGAFLAACAEIGRRPLLLLDNLDLILDALKGPEAWRLREVLQRPGGPVVVGAATQHLQQASDRGAPFYEFFHPHVLEPLSETELLACMDALAVRRGAAGQPVRAILSRQPERIRTLYALTGGNPRVLALIYQVLERSETDTIFADLEALLDQVTPFYKARVEEYSSPQQRAVIDAIALNWDPIGSGALAEATGIEVTTISSHLSRLKRSGFVEEVASSGARSGYQLAERFLNIWYLMRHGTRRTRHRLRWLTLFLARLYSSEELGRMALEADGDGPSRRWHPHFRAAFDEARRVVALSGIGGAPGDFDIPAPSGQGGIDPEIVAQFDLAAEHIEAGRFEQAVAVYGDTAVRLGASPEPQLRELVGKALVNKAYCLIAIGRSEEAVAVCDEVVSRFAASQEPGLRKQVAMALVNKGNALGRAEEAITTYGDVVSRFAAYPDLREEVARALVYKGVRLWTLGRSEEAIEVCGDVVSRFAASPEPELREQVAIALVNKGITLGELGRREEAIAVYSEVVARFAESQEPALLEQVAMALVNKGAMLGALGKTEEAIAVYDEVVARFAESQEPALLIQVAMALVNKGARLGALGRSEEAIAVYGDVVARFAALPEQTLHEPVARALVNKGVRLGALGRSEEAITVFDDVVARIEASPEPALREAVARALVNKGITLGALGRSAEEVAVYDEVVARFEASPELALRGQVARAMVNKGVTLGELGRSAEELAVYDDVVARFATSPEPVLRKAVAVVLVLKGNLLLDQFGELPAAEAAYRRALEFDGGSALAHGNLAWVLLAKGEAEAARAVVAGLDGIPEPGRGLLAAGIELVSGNLGNAFAGLGKVLDAGFDDDGWSFFDDLLRFLRIAGARGHGEAAIAWFEESGHADRSAPVHAALVAFVRGEAFLNDVNPEMRPAARKLFERLSRPGRATPPPAPKPRRRSSRKGR